MPKILQGHCHFQPASEVTGSIPRDLRSDLQIFCVSLSLHFQLLCGQPSIFTIHESLEGQGHHTATRASSMGNYPNCLSINSTSQICFSWWQNILYHRFEGWVLPRFKIKIKNRMCNDCKQWFLSLENCMCRRQQQGCINFSEFTTRAASWSYYKTQFQTGLQDHKP